MLSFWSCELSQALHHPLSLSRVKTFSFLKTANLFISQLRHCTRWKSNVETGGIFTIACVKFTQVPWRIRGCFDVLKKKHKAAAANPKSNIYRVCSIQHFALITFTTLSSVFHILLSLQLHEVLLSLLRKSKEMEELDDARQNRTKLNFIDHVLSNHRLRWVDGARAKGIVQIWLLKLTLTHKIEIWLGHFW